VLDKLAAIVKRDLLSAARFRGGGVLQLLTILGEVLTFFYLARAVGPGFRPDGMDYYPFLLTGTTFYAFVVSSVALFVGVVRDSQLSGTMEVLMTTSTPASLIVALTATSSIAGRCVSMMVIIGAGLLLFGVPLRQANVLGLAVVLVLSIALTLAIGMLAAAAQIAFRKGSGVVWLLATGGSLLSGAMFPVDSLPTPLKLLANAIPLTYSLRGLRVALLAGAPINELAVSGCTLLIWTLILVPVSIWLLSASVRSARLNGTLSFY
jgi:ABC-2 type transport system permease protein